MSDDLVRYGAQGRVDDARKLCDDATRCVAELDAVVVSVRRLARRSERYTARHGIRTPDRDDALSDALAALRSARRAAADAERLAAVELADAQNCVPG